MLLLHSESIGPSKELFLWPYLKEWKDCNPTVVRGGVSLPSYRIASTLYDEGFLSTHDIRKTVATRRNDEVEYNGDFIVLMPRGGDIREAILEYLRAIGEFDKGQWEQTWVNVLLDIVVMTGTDVCAGTGRVDYGVDRNSVPSLHLSSSLAFPQNTPRTIVVLYRRVHAEKSYAKRGLNSARVWYPRIPSLQYIDGCGDECLLAPIKKGMPCVNMLWIGPGTQQTWHVHPSDRIGLVVGGSGSADVAVYEQEQGSGEPSAIRSDVLHPGRAFILPALTAHRFRTERTEKTPLTIVVFHTSSLWGPTDASHPMMEETWIMEDQYATQSHTEDGD